MDTLDMYNYHPRDYEVRAHPEPEMARNKRLSTPGYFTSTKGHSVLRNKWGYGGRAMSPVDDLYLSDVYRPRNTSYYDTTGTENEIRRNVNRELLFSSHAADDAFDVAAKSRNRDQEILREATNAIGIKDRLSSGYSALSEAVRLPRYRRRLPLAIDYEDDEDTYSYGYSSPLPLLSHRKRIGDYSYGRERLNMFPLLGSRHRALTSSDASLDQIEALETYDPDAEQQLTTLEKIKIKAALVGSRVDVVTPKSRKPKSEYAAKVIRRIRKEERDQTVPEDVTVSVKSTSKPVSTTSTRGGKAIRAVDGYTQPKNILSWQYRIDSRVDPEDVIQMPKTYEAVRKQMKDVQCRMDKHRQLMDRYLEPDLKPETEDVKSKIMNLYVDMEQRNPSLFRATGESVTSSSTEHREISTSVRATSVRPPPVSFNPAIQYHRDDSEFPPMSDVRRRVRSVIRKNKRAASVL
ncbi:uncharacterized protein LOC110446328 isoform X15 [Mizuhopecten yessoensis]|uniref:uncharacterized protein LOC110446328 isoform X15 n=1 Tax=Mizuhopecten yessoensis TaxID=6573 RepID=UPI000B45B6CC|nr:uncharacterized protein LOC110446328 isoform X15 [Mizuhopecten yessoensis]